MHALPPLLPARTHSRSDRDGAITSACRTVLGTGHIAPMRPEGAAGEEARGPVRSGMSVRYNLSPGLSNSQNLRQA
jgi:hypothetical protein